MMNVPADGRRLDLDWIRIAAFGLLILYHVGMLYVPWNFHANGSPAPSHERARRGCSSRSLSACS
jgi:hypothetical protein